MQNGVLLTAEHGNYPQLIARTNRHGVNHMIPRVHSATKQWHVKKKGRLSWQVKKGERGIGPNSIETVVRFWICMAPTREHAQQGPTLHARLNLLACLPWGVNLHEMSEIRTYLVAFQTLRNVYDLDSLQKRFYDESKLFRETIWLVCWIPETRIRRNRI
jgi:hypothetical protein